MYVSLLPNAMSAAQAPASNASLQAPAQPATGPRSPSNLAPGGSPQRSQHVPLGLPKELAAQHAHGEPTAGGQQHGPQQAAQHLAIPPRAAPSNGWPGMMHAGHAMAAAPATVQASGHAWQWVPAAPPAPRSYGVGSGEPGSTSAGRPTQPAAPAVSQPGRAEPRRRQDDSAAPSSGRQEGETASVAAGADPAIEPVKTLMQHFQGPSMQALAGLDIPQPTSDSEVVMLQQMLHNLDQVQHKLRHDQDNTVTHLENLVHDMLVRPPRSHAPRGRSYACSLGFRRTCERDDARLKRPREYRHLSFRVSVDVSLVGMHAASALSWFT